MHCNFLIFSVKDLIMDDSGLTPDEAEEIRLLTPDEASRMFENTVLLLQQCMEMKITEAKEFRRKSFVNLKKEFLEMAAANENKEIPELALPDELPVDYLPPVSPIAHLAIQDNNGDISSSAYTFPTPMDQERLGFTPYPKTPVFDSLLAILKMYSGTADEDDPLEVRICLAGDNTLIHRFVCAYMSIVTEHSNLLSGIILRIFVVPLQKSLVASYIARFDSWYK